MSLERLDKILSHEGFGTRKNIKKFLRSNEVFINGKKITDGSFQINQDSDEIIVNEKKLALKKNIYLMMNKKANVVSAKHDSLYQTVFDFLEEEYKTPYLKEKLHIVGRLDLDTEGLILFTTDGILTHKITSPKTHLPKKYFVRLKNSWKKEKWLEVKENFFQGIYVHSEGKEAAFNAKSANLENFSENECELTITEGKYHQVKRMFLEMQNEVTFLKRIAIGNLKLDENLSQGEYRPLNKVEINELLG